MSGLASKLFLFLACLFILACGSSTGSSSTSSSGTTPSGTGSGNAPNDVLSGLDTVRTVVSSALNVVAPTSLVKSTFPATATIDQHIHCTSGKAATSGSIDDVPTGGSFSISADFDYENCDGLSGDLSYSGTYSLSDGKITFTGTVAEGSVSGNGCALDLAGLTYSFVIDAELIQAPESESVSGAISATCEESGAESAEVNCDWTSSHDPENTSAALAECSCLGEGCS